MKKPRWFKRSVSEPISNEDLAKYLDGKDSWSGIDVDRHSAMGIAAVWACVRVLSETLASLPVFLYRRIEKGKEKAADHPLYDLLHIKPNSEETAFQFKETMMSHVVLQGNCYANKVTNGTGYVRELWPLSVENVKEVKRVNGELFYVYRDSGRDVLIPKAEMFHVPGLGYDGIRGYSPIELLKQQFGSAIASRRYGAEFFKNGGRPDGVLKHPGKLKDEAFKRLRDSWASAHSDWGSKSKTAILEEGADYQAVSIPPEHAQFIETMKFSVNEIARIFRVPPHLIADLDRATFSNIEHQGIEFVVHTMRPWLVRWEQAITLQLIPEREQREYFAEFQVDALLRGDIQARYQAYRTGREMGVLSANDIRALENMNPIDGGDDYFVPMNWIPQDMAGEPIAPPAVEPMQENAMRPDIETRARKAADNRFRLAASFRGLFEENASKIIRKERRDITLAAGKYLKSRGLGEFDIWLEEYYRELPSYIVQQITPTYRTFMAQVKAGVADEIGSNAEITSDDEDFVRSYVAAFARRYIGKSRKDIDKYLAKGADSNIEPDIMVDAMFDDWDKSRAVSVAHSESTRGSNAFAKSAYLLAGITSLRWITTGAKTCPYCSSLDGSVIEIHNDFALPGDQLIENDNPMEIQSHIGHPPLHRGCDCQIVSA